MLTTRAISLLLGLALAVSMTTKSQSRLLPGRPNCPFYDPQHKRTWKKFLMGEYGDKPNVVFTVRFDHLTHNIGTIPARGIFTVSRANGVWTASGKNVFGDNNTADYSNGDPAQQQLSVWGALLNYNEAGEIYFNKELVGTLSCDIGG